MTLTTLNKKAREFLLDHCVSRRGAEVMAFGFTGYINGESHENTTLIRRAGNWEVFETSETINSLKGDIYSFSLTNNTLKY